MGRFLLLLIAPLITLAADDPYAAQLFQKHCASCHESSAGASGRIPQIAARDLNSFQLPNARRIASQSPHSISAIEQPPRNVPADETRRPGNERGLHARSFAFIRG